MDTQLPRTTALGRWVNRGKGKGRSACPRPFAYVFELDRYLIVKELDFVTAFPAASLATIFTVFFPLATFGEL